MPPAQIGNTIVEYHPRTPGEEMIDVTALDPAEGFKTIRVPLDVMYPDAVREFCLVLGGTLISVESEDGARPGMGVEELLGSESDVEFNWDETGQQPRLVLPRPESPYYFGPVMDSSQLQPEHFARVAEICHALCKDPLYHRITIVTGTDTAEYLAAALSRMLSHPNKPILIVASMRTPKSEGSDALPNFHLGRYFNSLLDPGIYLFLDQDAHDARRVTKAHSMNLDAFQSVNAAPVATYRHDMHPFVAVGLNYLSRADNLRYRRFLQHAEEAWDWCQSRQLPHPYYGFNLHVADPGQKAEVLSEHRTFVQSELDRFAALSMLPTEQELRFPPATTLNTKFNNLVCCERIIPGYRPEWLHGLLERDDVHGLVLSGIESLSPETSRGILEIVARFARSKPIVAYQDPSLGTTPQRQNFQSEAIACGAIPSLGYTLAYGTFALKWLLGQNLDLEDLKTAWKFAEATGGPGYVAPRSPRKYCPTPLQVAVQSHIRYVHLIPGYEPAWLDAALSEPTVQGAIIGAFGTGNIPFSGPRELLSVITDHAPRIPIVIRTQCTEGPTDLEAYEPGVVARKAGVQSAGLRSLEQTLVDLDALISGRGREVYQRM